MLQPGSLLVYTLLSFALIYVHNNANSINTAGQSGTSINWDDLSKVVRDVFASRLLKFHTPLIIIENDNFITFFQPIGIENLIGLIAVSQTCANL